MIDASEETLMSVSQAARDARFKVQGRSPHIATVWRWIKRGVSGIRLESIRLPRGTVTSSQAIDRFLAALNDAQRPATPPERDRVAAAKARLRARGLQF